MPSTSTATPRGREAAETAERECLPASPSAHMGKLRPLNANGTERMAPPPILETPPGGYVQTRATHYTFAKAEW